MAIAKQRITPFLWFDNHFRFNEAVSLQVNCKDQKEIDHYWEKLGAGGDPTARQCGWLKDRYGPPRAVLAREALVVDRLGMIIPRKRSRRMMSHPLLLSRRPSTAPHRSSADTRGEPRRVDPLRIGPGTGLLSSAHSTEPGQHGVSVFAQ